jgi:hypothetical protein
VGEPIGLRAGDDRLGGFALAVFVAWKLPARFLGRELDLRGAPLTGLRVTLRFVAPALVLAAAGASC